MIDARLVGRVIEAGRTVSPLLAIKATALDLNQPPLPGNVRAQVAARLADGTFRVLIDGKALKLALPADVKPGDVLELRVLGREGDPSAAGQASAPGKGVSPAGQLVADLLKQPAAPPARQSQPVLDVPPRTPDELPEPLARAVERSGLFYESHQARWAGGDFPLDRLMQEPQAAAGRPAVLDKPQGTDGPAPADARPEPAPSGPKPAVAAMVAASADNPEDTAPVPGTELREGAPRPADKGPSDIVARETLALVRQQLETLETRHFQWFGEIWPGQAMRWEIGEEQHEQETGRDDAHAWDSRFTLELPGLGSVGAELQLCGQQLRIRVSAGDEATARTMRESGRELVQALEAAGIRMTTLEVQHREPAL